MKRIDKQIHRFSWLLVLSGLCLSGCITFTPPSEILTQDSPAPDLHARTPEAPLQTFSLLSNRISSLAIDSRYVWVGTDKGLSRYDKQYGRWEHFTVNDGLAHNSVLSIALEGDLVWIGTKDGANSYDASSDSWTRYTQRDGLAGRQVSCIAVDSKYTWFGTENGLSRYDKETESWSKKNKDDGLAGKQVTQIVVEDDYIWISTDGGVSRYDRRTESWSNYTKNEGLVDNYVSAIAAAADSIWFGTQNKGLSLYDKRNSEFVKTFTKRDQLSSDKIRSLMVDGTSLWVGTADSGAQRHILAVKTWRNYTTDEGLPSHHITAMESDGNSVWFGTYEDGLACYDTRDETWAYYLERQALCDNSVNQVMVAGGNVWVATPSGLSECRPLASPNPDFPTQNHYSWGESESWRTLTRADGLTDNYVTCVLEEGKHLWVGTPRGLGKREDGYWTFYTSREGLPDDFVMCIACGKDRLWIGTRNGLAALSMLDEKIQYPVLSIQLSTVVNDITLDDNALWAGTLDGLVYHDISTGESLILTQADGLPANSVNTVRLSDKHLWIGTAAGLVQMTRGPELSIIRCYTVEDGLPNNNVRTLAIDSDGIWVGTPAGLAKLIPVDTGFRIDTYTRENTDGKLHDNITSISLADGRVWVGTTAGVSCYDMDKGDWTRHISAATTEVLKSNRVGRLAKDGSYIWFSNWHDSIEGAIGQFNRDTETFRFFTRYDLPLKPTENPITYLRCITVTKDCVWFGTNGGLLCYRKATDTWQHYTTDDGIANNDVWNVVDDGQYIWISHIGGVASRGEELGSKTSMTWKVYEICPSVVWSNIGSIDTDSRYVWFTTTWDGVRRYDKLNDTWESFSESDGLGGNETNQVLIDGDYVWISTWGDVSRYHKGEGKWETFSGYRVLSGPTMWMDRGIDGIWLMYSYGDRIASKYSSKTNSWTTLNLPRSNERFYGATTQTLETMDSVWFATEYDGVLRYNKASKDWTMFNEENGLPSNRISERGLLADDKHVWVGTDKGLCRYNKKSETWLLFTQPASAQTLNTRKFYAIAADQNYLWMGVSDGLHRYDKRTDNWAFQSKPTISCIAVDEKYVWAGTNEGLRRYNKTAGSWEFYMDKNGLPSNYIRDIDIEGYDLWIGTSSGAAKYNRLSDDPNAWEVYTCALDIKATQDEGKYVRSLASNDVRCVAVGEKAVWFGTDKGASRYDKSQRTWTTFASEDGLFGTDISSIVIDRDDVWFGAEEGATKYSERTHDFVYYTGSEGLASDVITCIALSDSEIWFGSSDSGATCLDKSTGKWRIFNRNDGLLHNRVLAIEIDGDHVWFATERGLCRYDKKTETWTSYSDATMSDER